MFKNPLSYKKDQEALLAELAKENSDAKTVAHLTMKTSGKALAQGALIGAAVGTLIVAVTAVIAEMKNQDED